MEESLFSTEAPLSPFGRLIIVMTRYWTASKLSYATEITALFVEMFNRARFPGRLKWKMAVGFGGEWNGARRHGRFLGQGAHPCSSSTLRAAAKFAHEARTEVHWNQVYFGQLIYLVVHDSERGRLSSRPVHMRTLDLKGKVVVEADSKSPAIVEDKSENAVFIWGDKYFHNGRVQKVNLHQQNTLANLWKQGDEFRDMQLLPSGIFANIPNKDAGNSVGQLLQMIKSKGSWTAYAPYLGEYGSVSHVAEADGKLVLGSTEGQVECLDIESGRPQWLYTFPVTRQTMSYSSPYGMPPYLTQQAAEYRKSVEKMSTPSGSILLPSDFQPASTNWAKLRAETEYPRRIIIDPNPDDPFHLGRYLTWLVVCASLPIGGALVLLVKRIVRRKSPKRAVPETRNEKTPPSAGLVAWFLVLSFSPAYGLLEYGHVSYSWTIVLKVIFVIAIAIAMFGTIRLCYAQRWLAAFLFSVILLGWVLLMLNPFRFA